MTELSCTNCRRPYPQAGVLFRCQVDSLERLAWHLLGLSCRLIVRRPPELTEAFERLAARAAESAARSKRPHDGGC